MARIRTIKPEFWASESLATRLPGIDGRQARLLFIALWNHAEDHGVCRAAPALLRSMAFPYDEDVTASDISRWLGLLEEGRFIVRYSRAGSSYAWIRAFAEHQKIDRKSKTTLPEPSIDEMDACASPRDTTNSPAIETAAPVASPRRALDEPSLQEGKGREGKGRERNTASQSAAGADARHDDLPDAAEAAHEVCDTRPPLILEAQTATPPTRTPSAGEALYSTIEFIRKEECERHGLPFIPSRWTYSRQNKDLGPIAKLPKGHEDKVRFEAAWLAFLADPKARELDEPLSLAFFWKMRSRYEGLGMRGET